MFLCLYSGGTRKANEALDIKLVERIGKRGAITYIPSNSTPAEASSYFDHFKRYYGYYGIRKFAYFCHDRAFARQHLQEALKSDAVYLSGGNTFYFRHSLKRSKVDIALKRFAARDGVVAGQSAGSIIVTPTISTASVGPIKDPNDVGLSDLSGLELVDTLFAPHYEQRKSVVAKLKRFSAKNRSRLIVAAEDGGGLVVSNGELSMVGPVTLFSGGDLLATVKR